MDEAISNSSTIIHLSAIGRLTLLREFYSKIIIPPAVWKEVVEEGLNRSGAKEIQRGRKEGWIEIKKPKNKPLLRLLSSQLDKGEAEAITLAIEQREKIIFLDESDARKAAEIYGLKKTGVIGVLIRAKLQGKISSLRHELDKLQREGNFWIDKELYNKALESVDENYE